MHSCYDRVVANRIMLIRGYGSFFILIMAVLFYYRNISRIRGLSIYQGKKKAPTCCFIFGMLLLAVSYVNLSLNRLRSFTLSMWTLLVNFGEDLHC